MKEGSLFVLFVMLRSPKPWCCAHGTLGKPSMSKGAIVKDDM